MANGCLSQQHRQRKVVCLQEKTAVATLCEWVVQSERIVFFGGAGVSTESGIPDFRSAQGLYQRQYPYPAEEMLSHDFLLRSPEAFYDFYYHELLHPQARPNAAHYALVRLETAGKLQAVITQNVDGLHQQAGSHLVLELHGSALRNYCLSCHATYGLETVLAAAGKPPRCPRCGGLIRPDIVLYQEYLDQSVLAAAQAYIAQSQLVIVGGTSLAVYPAAGLVELAGGRVVIINRGTTSYDRRADLVIDASIGQTLAYVVEEVLG